MKKETTLARFRRALRRSDQLAFEAAHQHLAAAAETSNALPMEIFLLSALIEEHKEVIRLRIPVKKSLPDPTRDG